MNTSIISWNVNGLRAFIKKVNLQKFLDNYKPTIFCMSETKLSLTQCNETIQELQESIKGYKYRYFNTSIAKKGYSGTAIWSKRKPNNITYGIDVEEHDQEGRVITIYFDHVIVLHVYTPNSGQQLQRLDYRTKDWDKDFRNYIKKIQKKYKNIPVIVTGDLNVAHKPIDVFNYKNKSKSAGFTPQERESFDKLLEECEFTDIYRYKYPDKSDVYSYWTYLRKSREKNNGWRIDYFLGDDSFMNKYKIKKIDILQDEMGSDHAPVLLEFSK